MKKTFKKILSVLMIAVMCLTMAPLQGFVGLELPNIFATEATAAYSSASINIGDKIVLGTYDGKPITWVCVDIDDNGPLMLSEKVICQKEYDAAGYNSKYHSDGWGYIREERGSNCWEDSNIRQWLNTSGKVAYSHCPPSYKNEDGFMSNFTMAELSFVKPVSHKVTMVKYDSTRAGYCDGGSTDVFSYGKSFNIDNCYHKLLEDRFMLLDASQMNNLTNKNSSYLSCGSSYFTAAISGNNYACFELVGTYGGGTNWACKNNGIRPAFYLDYYGSDVMNEIQQVADNMQVQINVKALNKKGETTGVSGADIFLYLGNERIKQFKTNSNGEYVLDYQTVTENGKYALNNLYISAEYQTKDYILYSEHTGDTKTTLRTIFNSDAYDFLLDKYCKKYNISVAYLKDYKERSLELIEDFRESFWAVTGGRAVIGEIEFREQRDYADLCCSTADIRITNVEKSVRATVDGFINGGHIYMGLDTKSQDIGTGNMLAHEAGHYFFGFRDEYCSGFGYEYDLNGNGKIDKKDYIVFYTESTNLPKNAKEFSINMTDGLHLEYITIYGIDIIGDLNGDGIVDGKYYYLPFADAESTSFEEHEKLLAEAKQKVDDVTADAGGAITIAKDYIREKTAGYWSTDENGLYKIYGVFERPGMFGVMDNNDNLQLSNASSYSYLGDEFKIVNKNYPGLYTKQYFENGMSCEEQFTERLNGKISVCPYDVVAHAASNDSSYYNVDLYLPDSEETFVVVDNEENIDGNEEIYLSAIETTDKLVDVSASIVDNKIIFTVNSDNYQTYLFVKSSENTNNINEIPLEFVDDIASFELDYVPEKEYIITFIQKDENDQYLKNTYTISSFSSEISDGTFYSDFAGISADIFSTNGVSNDLLIVKNDNLYVNGDFTSIDGAFDIIKTNDDVEISGDLIKSISLNAGFNYETIGVFKYENDTYTRIIQGYDVGEKQDFAYVTFPYEGDGTYVVMAEPASDEEVAPVTNLSVTESTELSGLYNVAFEDENNNVYDLAGYNIYYSMNPLDDLNNENVYCITISPYSKSYNINLKDNYGVWYFAVESLAKSGSKSSLSNTVKVKFNPLDTNNDGLPDYWLNKYSISDSDTVAMEDPDEDGLTNLREYELGTNPVNTDTDGDNVYDNVEVFSGLNPLNTHSDGTTDDYIIIYGTPDLSIVETSPYIVDGEVICTLKNNTTGKAMRTSINLYIDDVLTDAWDVNVDSESEITFTFPVEYLAQVKDSLRIEVDEGQITRDVDYSNNTFVYTPITELSFESESVTVTKGDSITLVPNTVPEGVSSIYKWSITDSTNISLDKNGIVKANGIGSAVVTAETYDGLSASCTIYSVAFDGAEYSEFDSRLINSETEVEIIGYIGSDTNIVIPSVIGGLPVTSISSLGSKGVESVTIPASITSVTGSAFNNLSLLKSIEVEEENNDYCSDNGILYSKDKTKLIRCPISIENKNVVVIDGVNEICQYAFYSVGIESVLLAESLSILRSYSFTNSGINSVEIPENVTRVEKDTFSNCYNLKEIKYNAKNAETGITTFTLIFSKASVFNSCSAVETISIGANVQIIPTGMFTYLTSVKTVNIVGDSNLNSVSSYAFNGSTNISDVYYGKYYKDWNSITISTSGNTPLSSATLHCKECDGHDWNISNYIVVPTCVSIGSATYVCEICGEEEVSEVPVDSSNHPETEIRDMQSATCSVNGYSGDTYCTKCNTKILSGESINANGHSLEFVEAKEPSCNAIGWEAYEYCTVCDYSTYLGIPASHNIVKVDAKAATCTEAGWEAYEYCTACDYTTYKEIPASHSIVTVDKKDSTCTEAGYEAYEYCTACDYTTYKEIPVIEHTKETVKGYVATCEKAGLTDGVKCSVCGETLTAQQSIAKLAHKDDNGDYKCDYGCGHAFEKPVEPEQPNTPDEPSDGDCDHLCHKGGFIGFIWKIVRFFWKLFKMNPVCSCGAAHY